MKKRIILLFLAIIIFFMPVQNGIFPNEANAIWGKVANMSAKKVAKEVIKDVAQETAANFAINEAMKIADARSWNLLVEENFTAVCLEALEPSGECKKPVQVKTSLSETDKANIGTTAEVELEKALNNGVKFTKWQKFLDFFLPIFSTTLILTGITYAIDPEVKSLFDEIAINTLIALGLMKPMQPEIKSAPTNFVNKDTGIPITDPSTPTGTSQMFVKETSIKTGVNAFTGLTLGAENTIVLTQYDHNQNLSTYPTIQHHAYGSSIWYALDFRPSTMNTGNAGYKYEMPSQTKGGKLLKNNEVIQTFAPGFTYFIDRSLMPGIDKTTAIMTRLMYQKDGLWYSDHLVFTVSGIVYTFTSEMTRSNYSFNGITSTAYGPNAGATNNYRPDDFITSTKTTIYTNAKDVEIQPYNPLYTDMSVPLSTSKYEKDGQVTLIPPVAIPYTHTDTGEQLELEHDPTTGTTEVVDKDGNIVPEDKVKVGDPVVTTDPQGKPQVQPPSTPSNPSPEPIPLTPTTTTPPPTPPKTTPPIETETPIFPEGESCDVGLKLPKFNPLMHTISDAFPFSIPFDLKDGFDAIFAEMGSEKPEFDYKFNFMGDEQSWKITIPDYFDSWKAFTDSFLVFIFDVGIIYAIYRFMSGGGS